MDSLLCGLWLALISMTLVMASPLDKDARPTAFHRIRTGRSGIQALLPDDLLIAQLRDSDDQYTKLERMLVNTVYTFRDRLSKPQPELGLPAFDPFVFTEGRAIIINTSMAAMNATLKTVNSAGISHFIVDRLSLYLVERIGVLDITVPGLSFDFVIDFPKGTWISPLKLPLDEQINVRFYSPQIKIKTRGNISVKNARLSMESTELEIELGEYDLELLSQRPGGSMSSNPGIGDVLAALVKRLSSQLIKNWTPVAEKYLAQRLDEKLQELQISDIINPPQE